MRRNELALLFVFLAAGLALGALLADPSVDATLAWGCAFLMTVAFLLKD